MINYTTPTISLVVEGVNLTGQDVYVTLKQGCLELTKTGADLTVTTTTHDQVTDTNIAFTLTQEESAAFNYNLSVLLQVNFINSQGVRDATNMVNIGVMRNLLDEVIAYGS